MTRVTLTRFRKCQATILVAFVCFSLIRSAPAQSNAAPSNPANSAAFAPAFDVVSIKPHPPSPGPSEGYGWGTAPKGFSATGIKTSMLIVFAYDLHTPDEILNSPAWARTDGFDVKAKSDEPTAAVLQKMSDAEADRMLKQMLRPVLADRFQLRIHHETRQLPVYNLVVAKSGPKMKASAATDGSTGSSMSNGYISGQGVPVAALAFNLSNEVGRQVIDKTGLTGNYDFELKWTPDEMQAAPESSDDDDSGASVFAAIQEQLGLKLESAKGPVDVLVIDHIERPSEN
ncbi:MAG TPA: TIGR03435 family protein [Terracidiphilus sp.]|nr:TIGR03435 family protein [Terracidiphilus sp.]